MGRDSPACRAYLNKMGILCSETEPRNICSQWRQVRDDRFSAELSTTAVSILIGPWSSDQCINIDSSGPGASSMPESSLRPQDSIGSSQASVRLGLPAEFTDRGKFSVEGQRVGTDGDHAVRKFSRAENG